MIQASWIRALESIEKLSTAPEAKRLAQVLRANLSYLLVEQIKKI